MRRGNSRTKERELKTPPIGISKYGLGAIAIALVIVLITIGLAMGAATSMLEASGIKGSPSVTRAELDGGRLRVEGEGAEPNAIIVVIADQAAVTNANRDGEFRIKVEDITSTNCEVMLLIISNVNRTLLFSESGVMLDPCKPDEEPEHDSI